MEPDRLTILAVDDNPDNLTVLEAILQDALPGARLVTAQSGDEGIALARTEDPDVILLDIVMPGMDGYAVCRKLKEEPRLRSIPVVFLTAARTDRESRLRALEAGAEAFLSKPTDEVELTAQIRAMAKIKAADRARQRENERLAELVEDRTRRLEKELTERRRAEVRLNEQLDELRRWQDAMLGREARVLELKAEVNELLARAGQPPRYPSAVNGT